MELSNKILSDITVYTKYAKYLSNKQRRETWDELVTRNKEMHIKSYPNLKDEIENVYKFVYDKKVLPSMRSMQSVVNQLRYHQIEFTTVLIYQLTTWTHFQKQCFCCWVEQVLDIQYKIIM